jgi:hypothetical protein
MMTLRRTAGCITPKFFSEPDQHLPVFKWDWKPFPVCHKLLYFPTGILLIIGHIILSDFFMFCWPYSSIYACNETNPIHCLSSVYSATIQQLSTVCGPADSRLRRTTRANCHIYIATSWWWATSKPETCSGSDWINWRWIMHQVGFITHIFLMHQICQIHS